MAYVSTCYKVNILLSIDVLQHFNGHFQLHQFKLAQSSYPGFQGAMTLDVHLFLEMGTFLLNYVTQFRMEIRRGRGCLGGPTPRFNAFRQINAKYLDRISIPYNVWTF